MKRKLVPGRVLADGEHTGHRHVVTVEVYEREEGVPNSCNTVAEALHSRKPEALAKLPIDDQDGQDWYEQGDVCIWPKDAKTVKRYPAILT